MPEVQTLRVKAKDPNKVGLWDVDPNHPANEANPNGGEVFVTGDKVFTVADNAEVRKALAQKRLVAVGNVPEEIEQSTKPEHDEDKAKPKGR